jgi:hypothetical protein
MPAQIATIYTNMWQVRHPACSWEIGGPGYDHIIFGNAVRCDTDGDSSTRGQGSQDMGNLAMRTWQEEGHIEGTPIGNRFFEFSM